MNTVDTDQPLDNPQTDPLLVFVARAQALAHLWYEGDLPGSDITALFALRPNFVRREEAIAIMRAAWRQNLRKRRTPR